LEASTVEKKASAAQKAKSSGTTLTVPKVWGMLIGFFASLFIVIYCALQFETDPQLSLMALLAANLGWLVGILIAPLSPGEASRFGEYAKLISGFVTGYLLSKIDPLITGIFKVDGEGAMALADPRISTRLLVSLCSFFIALLVVFCARAYWSPWAVEARTSKTVKVEPGKAPANPAAPAGEPGGTEV